MDKPTSKRIIEIEASNTDKIVPHKITKNEIEPISMMDFEELSMASGNDKIYLQVPFNDFFKEGCIIIDTPGIDSIDKMDSDITFGYLPFLDGAVICQDIQKGTLPKSLLNFLLKPEIKPILNHFIFAITKADLKPNEAKEKIKKDIINQLELLKKEHNLNLTNIESRVVLTSKTDLNDLKKSFEENIIKNKIKIIKYRKNVEIGKIIDKAIEALKYHKENLDLSIDDVKEKEQEIEEALSQMEQKEFEISNKIEQTRESIKNDIKIILINFIPELKKVDSEEELLKAEVLLQKRIQAIANSKLSNLLGKDLSIKIDSSIISFNDEIKTILNGINIGKQISTFIFFDLILPGSGVLGVAEGGAGLIVREGAKGVLKNNVKKTSLKIIVNAINKLNLFEYVGDFAKDKLIESKIESKIPSMSHIVSMAIIESKEKSGYRTISAVKLKQEEV